MNNKIKPYLMLAILILTLFLIPINETCAQDSPNFSIKIQALNKTTETGENIAAKINIQKIPDERLVDIIVYYSIKDSQNKIANFREETIAIKNTLELIRSLKTPDDLPGDYSFYAKVIFENTSAESSDFFQIQPSLASQFNTRIYYIFGIISMTILVLIIISYKIVNKK